MNGIQVTFTARVARVATVTVSLTGVKRTRIKVDIPLTVDSRTGQTSNTWATITGVGEMGEKLARLEVGDVVFVEGGLRLDSSGRTYDAQPRDKGGSLLLTFWPSEFSQVRGQWRHTRLGAGGLDNEFLFQMLFSIGAHGAHGF